jgi:hypothetical protein
MRTDLPEIITGEMQFTKTGTEIRWWALADG